METTASDTNTVVGKNYLVLYTLWKTLLPIMRVKFVTKGTGNFAKLILSYILNKLSCKILQMLNTTTALK